MGVHLLNKRFYGMVVFLAAILRDDHNMQVLNENNIYIIFFDLTFISNVEDIVRAS